MSSVAIAIVLTFLIGGTLLVVLFLFALKKLSAMAKGTDHHASAESGHGGHEAEPGHDGHDEGHGHHGGHGGHGGGGFTSFLLKLAKFSALCIFLGLCFMGYYFFKYGLDGAPKVLVAEQKRATQAAIEGRSEKGDQNGSSRSENFLEGSMTIKTPISREWTRWIQIPGGRCIWVDRATPDQAQLKEKEGDESEDWDSYKKKEAKMQVGEPGWIRLRSNGKTETLTYEFRRRNQC